MAWRALSNAQSKLPVKSDVLITMFEEAPMEEGELQGPNNADITPGTGSGPGVGDKMVQNPGGADRRKLLRPAR